MADYHAVSAAMRKARKDMELHNSVMNRAVRRTFKMQDDPKAVPLTELLRSIPRDARLKIEDDWKSSTVWPIGILTHDAAARVERLEAERFALAEALKFYAKPENWKATIEHTPEFELNGRRRRDAYRKEAPVITDNGKLAREALRAEENSIG